MLGLEVLVLRAGGEMGKGFYGVRAYGEVRVHYLVVMAYHGKLDEAENLPQEESGGVRWGS